MTATLCLLLAGLLGRAPTLAADTVEAGAAPMSGGIGSAAVVHPAVVPLREALAPLIAGAQDRFAIPGISLVLVRGEETLWAEGFGWAAPQERRPASAGTRYRAGSLAKPITALAVLQLEALGALDIDQPVSAALPGFRVRSRFDLSGNPITPRRLLTHHAGLPSDLNKGLWTETPLTAVTAQLRDTYLAFPPGLVFSYSNLGYAVLGHMVQQHAGADFAAHVEQALLAPLGMRDTMLSAGTSGTGPPAAGHRHGEPFSALPVRDVPALGLTTSSADLGRLMQALLCGGRSGERQVIAPSVIEAMLEPQNTDVPLDLGTVVGLGWFLEQETIPGASRVARHSGTMLGHSAELILLPEQGLGVAVLANSGGAGHVLKQLGEAVLAQTLKAVPEPLPADLFIAAEPPARDDAAAADGPPLAGSFATDFGLISIRSDSGELCACLTDDVVDLMPRPNGWYAVAEGDVGGLQPAVRPLAQMRLQTRRIGEREVVVAHTGNEELVIGERVPPGPLPAAWRERLGRYQLINPDPDFPVQNLELKLTDGKLCLSYAMPVLTTARIRMPVQPVSDEAGIILGLGRSRGDTLRVVDTGDESLLRWSGYLARRITP